MALLWPAGYQFLDSNGNPVASGTVSFFDTGTADPRAIYSDIDMQVTATNPYSLDAAGRLAVNIYGSGTYTVTVKKSDTTTVFSRDDVFGWVDGVPYYERTAAEISAGVTPTAYQYEPGDVRRYGAVGDGSTDDSAAIQDAIDANKGGVAFIPAGLTCSAAGILLSGSGYDDTTFRVDGTFKLKASGGSSNFGGAWVGIIVKDCDNVTISINDADGNRANQAATEYHHILGVAGATNLKIPFFSCREIRGDGIYVSQSTWTSNTTNPSNIQMGVIKGYNTADDGRNLVSIISCTGFTIGEIHSTNIGGSIASVTQPGGLDIEPSQTYHSVTKGLIGEVNVVTAGTSGCAVYGKSVGGADAQDWNCTDIHFGTVRITRTGSLTTAALPIAYRALRVSFGNLFVDAATKDGVQIDYCRNITGKISVYNATTGAFLGYSGTVDRADLCINVDTYSSVGIQYVSVNYSTIKGRVFGATSASSTFAQRIRPIARTVTVTGLALEVDCPYDGNNVRALRTETGDAGTLTIGTGTCIRNCDFSGYASYSVQLNELSIPSFNVQGRTHGYATVQPANGAWAAGDVVWNKTPSKDGSNMILAGWIRLTSGTGNVAGTDWVNMRVSDVSPAT